MTISAARHGLRVGFVLLCAVGCGQGGTPAATLTLPGTAWLAEEIDGGGVAAGVESTLEFSANRVTGSAGCNRLTGPVTIDGAHLTFGALATTRRMCPPPAMEQEQRLLAVLANVRRFEGREGKLLLLGDGSEVLARLVSHAAAAP
jgi:heat shock protein HslJ